MQKYLKKLSFFFLTVICVFTIICSPVYAEEGKSDSYWGHIPENKTFAFVDSRYYDGTDYVKVFNVGFYMGNKGEYYTNGDWTDLSKVYRREDYYKNDEFIEFSQNGKVGEEKPTGYPVNDVGGDANGKLSSYNAGTYTTLSWTNFEMFGRYWFNNYGIDSVINASGVTTYVEIWKVAPELTLNIDKSEVVRGDTFTLTLSINNHFDNMEGLPKETEVSFELDNAKAISGISKSNNLYTQTFKATEDTNIHSINIKAGVKDIATNYKEKYIEKVLNFKETYHVSYEFISGTKGKEIPDEIVKLLPQDENLYDSGEIVTAIQPDKKEIVVDDGVWKFSGYDTDSKIADTDIKFVGTWIFTENKPEEQPTTPTTPDKDDSSNITPQDKSDSKVADKSETVQTGDTLNVLLWSMVSVFSLAGMLTTIIIRRRESE